MTTLANSFIYLQKKRSQYVELANGWSRLLDTITIMASAFASYFPNLFFSLCFPWQFSLKHFDSVNIYEQRCLAEAEVHL